jgi:hypothetical protein
MDQPVSQTLLVSLSVIMSDEFGGRSSQRVLTEKDQPFYTRLLDGSHKPLPGIPAHR